MKITIEIAEQEIAEEVKSLIIQNAVLNIENDIYGGRGSYSKGDFID